jgi:hypothetical protein
MESAKRPLRQERPESAGRPKIKQAKVRRDSQGSLPKSVVSPYLDDNTTEL